MSRKPSTIEESQAVLLAKAIRHRESMDRARISRSKHLACVRAANEARMKVAIKASAERLAPRIAKMRSAKIEWMRSGHATSNIPPELVKYVELD